MFQWLDLEEQEVFLRAAHQRLFAPQTFAQRRAAELGFLAKLLDEVPQSPDRLPYVQRAEYDKRRPTEAPDAPLSARLVERYGSWRKACYVAWGLLPDGSNRYIKGPVTGRPRPAPYTREEAVASVLQCAEAIGHIPSSGEYHTWQLACRRRAREQGRSVRLARYGSMLNLIAPDRTRRNGWQLVVERIFGVSSHDT